MQPVKPVYFDVPDLQSCGNFIPVPLCHQETEYTCAVACVQSTLARYGIWFRQDTLAEILHQKPILGTDYQNIISYLQRLGFSAMMAENMSIDDLKNYIDEGIAPMLVIQAWPDDEIEYPFDWKDAHCIVACGYYDQGIYVMDPWTLGNFTYLSFTELMERWHAVDQTSVRHLQSGIIAQYKNCPLKYNPRAVKHLG